MKKLNCLIALTVFVIVCLFHAVSYAQMRDFVGSNGRIIEAAFLGFDEATQIVKLRLKDGREQNVKLDLFSAESQQWIKAGGKDADADNPFGDVGTPLLEQEGDFEWLFDGRSLNGWEGDTNVWRANQNEKALINTGRGNLFTTKQYDNFIIQLEFRCDNGANNGLMIRVDDAARQGLARQDISRVMEIQIADDRNISGPNHNGSIFNALSGPKPFTFYDRNHYTTRGWNFMEVIAHGQKITTFVNGMKVVDDTLPQDKPFPSIRSGHIGLMGFGGTTAFRYIRIKPLKAGEDGKTSRITANDSREGFQPIFDGRTLNGWRGDQDKFRVENNMLIGFDPPGRLETINEYRNFTLRFEFRLSRNADNSVHIRKSGGNNGIEFKVADDSNFSMERPILDFHGSICHIVPARRGSMNAVGQWNTMEITANGSMFRVVTNDQIIVDTTIRNIVIPDHFQQGMAAAVAGLHNKSGHIEFFGVRYGQRGGQTDFRNIRIKELP